MKLLIIIVAIIPFVVSYSEYIEDRITNTTRLAKWFPFPVGFARFANSFCTGSNGLYGTCYTRRVCRIIDGQSSGRCQTGNLGACCIIQRTCGATSSYNNTYFVNPNFPNADTGSLSCTITIPPCGDDICQLRIDFMSLSLAQPNGIGVCNTDTLIIEGGASPLPVICGENSGQHVYVGFNGLEPIRITITINGNVAFERKWTLRIAQIACSCPTLAPVGCLMYYTARTGVVNSFNYGRTISSGFNGNPNVQEAGTRELVNLNYGVCVDMLPGYCAIRWTQVSNDIYSFTVSMNSITPTPPAGPLTGENCPTDYIVIPNPLNSITQMPFNTDRFCGNQLLSLYTYSKPFVMTVVTDNQEATDVGNRGFSLRYEQIPCTVTMMQ